MSLDGTRDTAARFAAPVWALVWLLTLGKFGRPLWRRRKREPVTSADLALLSPRSRAMWLMQAAQGCPPPHPFSLSEAKRRWREPAGTVAVLQPGVGHRGPAEVRPPTAQQIPWYPPKGYQPFGSTTNPDPGRGT